ncbi:unnamed protein product [Didymodactylos carnosus]|uniref:Protein kinase domain-containing protein n=1 Tax=Didymodactylos carnosus TaxID=1234261 RepID=A0A8S2Q790_9BILA|nr:unnamed protein product [Didymodactylos carnosus]CAF4082172.1 unnamed protein product [Didymodactylos carnosus]
MECAPGYSLGEFIQSTCRGGIGLLESVQFAQHVVSIVKEVHSHGIVHQNLEPNTITIEWDRKHTSIDQAKLMRG